MKARWYGSKKHSNWRQRIKHVNVLHHNFSHLYVNSYDLQSSREDRKRLLLGPVIWIWCIEWCTVQRTQVTIGQKFLINKRWRQQIGNLKTRFGFWQKMSSFTSHLIHSSQLMLLNKIFQREFLQKGIICQCGRWWMCLRFVWSLLTRMHPNVHHSGVPQLHKSAPPSKSEIGPKSEHKGVGN